MLQDLFQELDFDVVYKEDLKGDEIRETAKQLAANDHSQFDAFIFSVLSHGGRNDAIYGVDDQAIGVTELMWLLKPSNCPTLQGKPKLVYIQDCKGRHEDLNLLAIETDLQSALCAVNSDTALKNFLSKQADFL